MRRLGHLGQGEPGLLSAESVCRSASVVNLHFSVMTSGSQEL